MQIQYYDAMLEYRESNNLQITINRSFEFMKDRILPHYSKRRAKYEAFDFYHAKLILNYYANLINIDYEFRPYKKMKTMNSLYQYLFVFISDIMRVAPRITISIYRSAHNLVKSLNNYNKHIGLKNYTKKKILAVINALNKIFKSNLDALIRLPYELLCLTKILNKDIIFDVFSKCNNVWLDFRSVKLMNNIYRIEIILLLCRLDKLNNHIILYILQFLLLKGDNIYDIFINLDKYNKKGINVELVEMGENEKYVNI